MGDRTFSAEDVLRIYREYLTESEMKTVEMFFEMEAMESIDLGFAENLLATLEDLQEILTSSILAAIAAVFGPFATRALNAAIRVVAAVIIALNIIISLEGVDA